MKDEIQLRLIAPLVALERLAKGGSLPLIFAKTALNELRIVVGLTKSMQKRGKHVYILVAEDYENQKN